MFPQKTQHAASQCALGIDCNEECIEEFVNTKFLGLQIDNHLKWKNHNDQVMYVFHVSNNVSLKIIYFACFHSVIQFVVFLESNSSYSKRILSLRKKIVRNSCRGLFKRLQILPTVCACVFSLIHFIGNN